MPHGDDVGFIVCDGYSPVSEPRSAYHAACRPSTTTEIEEWRYYGQRPMYTATQRP